MDDFHEALDAARVIVARLRPLLALPEVIEAALKAGDAVRAAEARTARLQADNDGLELDRARLADELNSERIAAEAERAERVAATTDLNERLHDARNKAQLELIDIDTRKRDALTLADAEQAAQKIGLQAEIAGLEATRDELQKQVAEAKGKFQAVFG